jgi:hypothetical protein
MVHSSSIFKDQFPFNTTVWYMIARFFLVQLTKTWKLYTQWQHNTPNGREQTKWPTKYTRIFHSKVLQNIGTQNVDFDTKICHPATPVWYGGITSECWRFLQLRQALKAENRSKIKTWKVPLWRALSELKARAGFSVTRLSKISPFFKVCFRQTFHMLEEFRSR